MIFFMTHLDIEHGDKLKVGEYSIIHFGIGKQENNVKYCGIPLLFIQLSTRPEKESQLSFGSNITYHIVKNLF